jgi:hypothetical protein
LAAGPFGVRDENAARAVGYLGARRFAPRVTPLFRDNEGYADIDRGNNGNPNDLSDARQD